MAKLDSLDFCYSSIVAVFLLLICLFVCLFVFPFILFIYLFIISTNIFAVSKVDEQTDAVSISNNIFLTQ